LRSTLDETLLIKKVLTILCDWGGIGRAAIVLKSGEHDYEVKGVRGIDSLSEGWKFSHEEPLFRLISLTRSTVAREELSGSLLLSDRVEEMMVVMERLSAHLVVPLIWGEKVQGLIAAGQRVSGPPFRVEDYEFVEEMATLTAVCLENVSLFRGLQVSERRYRNLLSEAKDVKRHLEETGRLKEEWIANVTHEILTPLNSILGYTQVLREEKSDSWNEEVRTTLDRIQLNAEVLHRLLMDMLNFSKARKGQTRIKKEKVHIGKLFETLGPFLSRLIGNGSVELRLNIPPDTWVETDRALLRGIMIAMLDNAAKFTQKGSIQVETCSQPSTMEIRVSDTGVGIKPEDQETIFEEFRQLDGSSTREHGGTGLGLAMCKRYAELLGGSLSVKSKLNVGSTFTLLLPRVNTLSTSFPT
jgi:signal transduction histidine kinase